MGTASVPTCHRGGRAPHRYIVRHGTHLGDLDPAKVAKHRADNVLDGAGNLLQAAHRYEVESLSKYSGACAGRPIATQQEF